MSARKQWTMAQVAEIKDLYEVQFKSVPDIAVRMSVQKTTMYRQIRLLGFKRVEEKKTPEAEAVLEVQKAAMKKMWQSGKSLGQIAEALTKDAGKPFTRNMVLGYIRRMKLPQRTKDARLQEQKAKTRIAKNMPKAAPVTKPSLPIFDGNALRLESGEFVTLETLEKTGMCRYPIGDPLQDGFKFCALPQKEKSIYCLVHHDKCYQPPTGVSKIDPKVMRNSGINRIG